ncbi:MAG: class I SAM-dependent methyltransferase [Rudaea sp.]
MTIVLSHFQVEPAILARREGKSLALLSTDLGLTKSEIRLNDAGIEFTPGHILTWDQAAEIERNPSACFLMRDGEIQRIKVFSDESNLLYSLYPTLSAPTMLISGVPMHRIKDTDPHADTLTKIRAIAPIRGRVLDTATGLGYTAIEAAKTADSVVTIEIDPSATEIARLNPWSRDLLENPKIEQLFGDSFEVIKTFGGGGFHCIIHDPPRFDLAGDLYSEEFYLELLRVLDRGGRLFHYIGDLESKSGRGVLRGVIERLKRSGFSRVTRRPEAFGVTAFK